MSKGRYSVLFLLFSLMVFVLPGISYAQSAKDGFNPDANSSVSALAVQGDGKILVGGDFTSIGGGSRNYIARLDAGGILDTGFVDPNPDGIVNSLALQPDGKILVGGNFFHIGTGQVQRNHLARLNADGTLDTGFVDDPNENGSVYSLALQPDGKVLIGGDFTHIGGQPRNHLARLTNTDAALQTLSVSPSFRYINVTWMRGQASPEVWRVTFERSTDGVTWTSLGEGQKIAGGWKLTKGLYLGYGNHFVRARGYARGGEYNASGSLFESIRMFYVPPPRLSDYLLYVPNLILRPLFRP
jgi:uncharacterized delta-60 repeat protein